MTSQEQFELNQKIILFYKNRGGISYIGSHESHQEEVDLWWRQGWLTPDEYDSYNSGTISFEYLEQLVIYRQNNFYDWIIDSAAFISDNYEYLTEIQQYRFGQQFSIWDTAYNNYQEEIITYDEYYEASMLFIRQMREWRIVIGEGQ